MTKKSYRLVEVKVGEGRTERDFLDLPKRIYKDYPNWECPFDTSIKAVLTPQKINSSRMERLSAGCCIMRLVSV